MNKVDKQALRKAAQNATDGPWVEKHGEVTTVDYEIDGVTHLDHICDCEIIGTESPNAEFIAASNPATMLALLDENEALEKRVEELASENAALKNYQPSPTSAAVFEAIEITESLFDEGRPELAMIRAFNIMKMKRSPSADTFINEMRAQGVEMLAKRMRENGYVNEANGTEVFAKQLREGKA